MVSKELLGMLNKAVAGLFRRKSNLGKNKPLTEKIQVYRCSICGDIVEILHGGVGKLACCGQPMEPLVEKTEDVGKEKHLPVIEKTDKGIIVKVGLTPHPMEEKHYIEWIEAIFDSKIYRSFLPPRGKPEAEFWFKKEKIWIRAYCNIHGLWKSFNP